MKITEYEVSLNRLAGLDTDALVGMNRFPSRVELLTSKQFPGSLRAGTSLTTIVLGTEKPTTSHAIETEIQSRGLRHASVHETLALTAEFPDLQRENPLLTLASLGRHGNFPPSVLLLWGSRRTRFAEWILPLDTWSRGYHFVAVGRG